MNKKEVKKMNIQEQAFAYHAQGYTIMPCKKDKTPMLAQWKPLQTTRPTDEQILEWFKNPKATIAILTGKASGITVIDVDLYHDGAKDIFPETFTVRTGNGGVQKYYQYIEGFTISASGYKDMPFVDLRSDGGYVIAPPSITDYIDKNTGKKVGGEYTILKNIPLAPFPINLFQQTKPKKTITELTTASKGKRNDTLASFVGKLLQATKEEEWLIEVLPAVQRANKTYTPQLSDKEVLTVFNSIVKKEKKRRENLTETAIVIDGQTTGEKMKITRNRSNIPYMNMANVIAILEAHPDFRKKIRYNTFKHEIEIDGVPIEDNDVIKVQHTLQTKFGLYTITRDAVYSALTHCAYENKYDEAQEWLKSLVWDGEHRLFSWLSSVTGVKDDEYHCGVGTQWFLGMVNRIMNPGCIFDFALVIIGPQGVGKTSMFRIIGDKWYKSFTGNIEGKDFFLQMRGAILMDLDEGATMYRAEVIKLKSIITQTTDEFRTPYDRLPKKFPRRFVFSMSTNDIEPFRDATGNRRYLPVDINQMVNFKWLEDNREQLFAEAYYWLQNIKSEEIPQIPCEETIRRQEQHLPDDAWLELVVNEVRSSADYCEGSPNYSTTILEIYSKIFPNEPLSRLGRLQEIRIGTILTKELGLVKKQVMRDRKRFNKYYIEDKKMRQLQKENLPVETTPLEDFVEDLKEQKLLNDDF